MSRTFLVEHSNTNGTVLVLSDLHMLILGMGNISFPVTLHCKVIQLFSFQLLSKHINPNPRKLFCSFTHSSRAVCVIACKAQQLRALKPRVVLKTTRINGIQKLDSSKYFFQHLGDRIAIGLNKDLSNINMNG